MKKLYSRKIGIFLLIFSGLFFLFLGFSVPKQPKDSVEKLPEQLERKDKIVVSQDGEDASKEAESQEEKYEYAGVQKVIDGDTIVLDDSRVLRYIGIDTPELRDWRGRVECFALQAKRANERLVAGKQVRLEKDVSETDKYGRILRYVYVGEIFVNEYLVREGYAKAVSFPPDVKYQGILQQAEVYARENQKGLWAPGACEEDVLGEISETRREKRFGARDCLYDCQGEDKDCKDFSTQAQAQEFFECCGFSAEYDPMNLDAVGIGDGIACESLP